MAFYEDERGFLYESVKWHTRKKHVFIEKYLEIWTQNVRKDRPTLDIIDLFASTGLCYCDEAERYGLTEPTWAGSALLAASCLQRYPRGKILYLNTYNPDQEDCKKQKQNLIRLLSGVTGFELKLSSHPIEKALPEAIKEINPRYPNLWLLDPYGASDLPWEIVQTIGNFRGRYQRNGVEVIRKPEMIITLVTFDLQRNIDTNPHILSTALGLPEKEWRPKFDALIKSGKNTREAIIELYVGRLADLYEKPPIVAEINSTDERNIVYCLLLCTDHNAGHYVMELRKLREMEEWRINEWRKEAVKITARRRLAPDQSDLSKFF